MKARSHVSDEVLAKLDDDGAQANALESDHLRRCSVCRRRRDELLDLRSLLALTGDRDIAPRRDAVPAALKRLRLRRNAVVNANELLGGLVAAMRGLASLFSVNEPTQPHRPGRAVRKEDIDE